MRAIFFGSRKKVSFLKTGRPPKQQKLELVHKNMWGPYGLHQLRQLEVQDSTYISSINDIRRKLWVYFLKYKAGGFDTFKKWKARVENETTLTLKCLRPDYGSEYDGKIKEYCAANRIMM